MTDDFVIGSTVYRWREVDLCEGQSSGWAHHDVAVLSDGSLVAAHPEGGRLVVLGQGMRPKTVETELTDMHGISPTSHGGGERLWICDIGHKLTPAKPKYEPVLSRGRVVQIGLAGGIHQELEQPEVAAYASSGWMPGAVAVDDAEADGTGHVWIADCYGQSLVHCYAADGQCVYTIDGADSGRQFSTPHALFIDRRSGTAELYVADRGNARLVVFDLTGGFLRTEGEGVLTSPSGMAVVDDNLFVTELFGSLAVLDEQGELVARVGDCGGHDRPGWPNSLDGLDVSAPNPAPGCFNSPHGIAVDGDGRVFVSEWMIGGRVIELAPL